MLLVFALFLAFMGVACGQGPSQNYAQGKQNKVCRFHEFLRKTIFTQK